MKRVITYDDFGFEVEHLMALNHLGITTVKDFIDKATETLEKIKEIKLILDKYEYEEEEDIPSKYRKTVKTFGEAAFQLESLTNTLLCIVCDETYLDKIYQKHDILNGNMDFQSLMRIDIEDLPYLDEGDVRRLKKRGIFCVLNLMERSWDVNDQEERRYLHAQYLIKKVYGMDLSNSESQYKYKILNVEDIKTSDIESQLNELSDLGYAVMSANLKYIILRKVCL